MIHGTDHLGHLEAAGIVADLFEDWLQFCKEAAIQFHSANRSGGKVSVVASGPQAQRPSLPLSATHRGRARPGRGASPSERRYGPARMGRR